MGRGKSRLVPSRYLSVLWGERRLGIRLTRARGLMEREETPRAPQPNPQSSLTPKNTYRATRYECGEREEARLFRLPIFTRALTCFDYLLFLLGYPAKASSEESLKANLTLKESRFHLFRSLNVRTTTITIKILLFTIYV